MFPGKASEKNGDAVAFFRGEGVLQGTVEVLDGLLNQPRSLFQPHRSANTRRAISSSPNGGSADPAESMAELMASESLS